MDSGMGHRLIADFQQDMVDLRQRLAAEDLDADGAHLEGENSGRWRRTLAKEWVEEQEQEESKVSWAEVDDEPSASATWHGSAVRRSTGNIGDEEEAGS